MFSDKENRKLEDAQLIGSGVEVRKKWYPVRL